MCLPLQRHIYALPSTIRAWVFQFIRDKKAVSLFYPVPLISARVRHFVRTRYKEKDCIQFSSFNDSRMMKYCRHTHNACPLPSSRPWSFVLFSSLFFMPLFPLNILHVSITLLLYKKLVQSVSGRQQLSQVICACRVERGCRKEQKWPLTLLDCWQYSR